MNLKAFEKNKIINYFIIIIFIYGVIIYSSKNIIREKSLYFQIKNKKNIDELLNDLENYNYNINKLSTTHVFNDNLPKKIRQKIDKIDYEILKVLGPEYERIPEINEVYYNAKKSGNSDKSFINLHSDSPYNFCQTYRVLVCLKPDTNVRTLIPNDKIDVKLEKYDVLGFDYANTLHYIIIDESKIKNNRILLKLHYAKTEICNKLTKNYSKWARSLFVNNLHKTDSSGYSMLILQFVSAYLLYFILFYLLLMIIYFCYPKQINILMYLLLFLAITLGLTNIIFQLYFFLK